MKAKAKSYVRTASVLIIAVVVALQVPAGLALYGVIDQPSPIETVSATHPGGDFGPWTGDTGNLNQPTNDTLTSNNNDVSISTQRDTSKSENQIAITFNMSNRQNSGLNDFINLDIENSGTVMIRLLFRGNGNIEHSGTDTGVDWVAGATYRIEFKNIDYSANTFDLYVNGENVGSYSFYNSVSGFDTIQLRAQTNTCGCLVETTFTDMRLDGSDYSIPEFNGVFKNFTDNNPNVTDVTGWEGWYGTDGRRNNIVSVSSNSFEGSKWGKITTTNAQNEVWAWSDSGPNNPDNFSIKIRQSQWSNDFGDGITLQLYKSGTRMTNINLRGNGSIDQHPQVWRPNSTVKIELRDINYANNTYALYVNGEKRDSRISFDNGVDGFDNIRLVHDMAASGETSYLYFNDIRMNGTKYDILRFQGGVLKGFGDGTTNMIATGWSGWYNETNYENTNQLQLGTEENTTVGKMVADNEQFQLEAVSHSGPYKAKNITVKFHAEQLTGDNADVIRLSVSDHKNLFARINFRNNGEIHAIQGSGSVTDTGFDWRANITYAVEFRNINYSANTYELWVNGDHLGTYGFAQNADGITRFIVDIKSSSSGSNMTVYFDDIRFDGPSYGEPSYTTGQTGYGYEGWYNETDNYFERGLVSGSDSVNGTQKHSEIYSSGGAVNISKMSVDITVTDRTVHPDDNVDLRVKHFADTHMAARLHMSTPQDQYDPNSDVSGNAITVRDGGAWREINLTWNNNSANTVQFENINFSGQSYSVRINGELATNPATGNNRFSMDGNLQTGSQNFLFRLDAILSGNTVGYNDTTLAAEYSDLSLGSCSQNCQVIQFFEVTTEESISFSDPDSGGGGGDSGTGSITLQVNAWMDYDSRQIYRVEFLAPDGTSQFVTGSATVTSNNTSVITVNVSTQELVSTDNETIVTTVMITAEYNELTDTANVTLANRTLENIETLPPGQWPGAVIGIDDPQTQFGLGSPIQWTLLAIFIGAVAAWKARNEWVGIGLITGALILFWTAGYTNLGLMLVGLFYAIFTGYQLVRTPSRSDTNVGGLP